MFEFFGAGPQAKSGYSQAVNFYVGARDVRTPGNGDINHDGILSADEKSLAKFLHQEEYYTIKVIKVVS